MLLTCYDHKVSSNVAMVVKKVKAQMKEQFFYRSGHISITGFLATFQLARDRNCIQEEVDRCTRFFLDKNALTSTLNIRTSAAIRISSQKVC